MLRKIGGGSVDWRTLFNGQSWVFLVFTRDRYEKFQRLFAQLIARSDKAVRISRTTLPPGLLCEEGCEAYSVPKADADRATVARLLREHFGYENPSKGSDIFTLGVMPEDERRIADTLAGRRKPRPR
jgi:hypothetical protein